MGRLAGRVALVTGAGGRRGIGRALALGMGREGARVVAADVDGELAEETAAAIRAAGGEALAVRVDVAVAADVEAMLARTVAAFGRLDVLVANAGIALLCPFLDLDEATWDRTFAVNVKGVYLCGQAAARQMVRQGGGGSIINLSSTSEVLSGPAIAHYAASKAAVGSLTRGMALALGPHRIRVNAIGPGTVQTDILAYLPPEEVAQRRAGKLARTPLGRLGTPEDIVGAAVFLASDEAAWVSGVTLFVDGAQLAAGL